jgi:NAD+-dependent secondary alcohol dehydrogenase Adh1
MEMIVTEKTIVGNLVELMALADRGLVTLATREYRLSQANAALHDLKNGIVKGRAVLIP